jgi:molecular chaperone Hsp33
VNGVLVRGLVADGAVRFLSVDVGGVADACVAAHDLLPESRRIAGEAIVACALMSAHIKGVERVTLQIQAESPRFAFIGECDAEGAVRARLSPPSVTYGPVTGVLLAIKSDDERETYRGMTAITSQSLAEALQAHLSTSDQVDVALFVDASGGVLFERLPEAPGHASITSEQFRERFRTRDIPEDAQILDVRPLVWRCRCSVEKVQAVLVGLGVAEIDAMISEGGATVACHFCNRPYRFDPEALRGLRAVTRG